MGVFDIIARAAGAVGSLLGSVFEGIDALDTTEEEKLILKGQLEEARQAFQIEMAQIAASAEAERGQVIRAEIASDSWLAKTWRPILMLTFGFVIVYSVVAPSFGTPQVDMSGIPDRMWTLMTVGIGGYLGARSVEKLGPTAVDWIKGFRAPTML